VIVDVGDELTCPKWTEYEWDWIVALQTSLVQFKIQILIQIQFKIPRPKTVISENTTLSAVRFYVQIYSVSMQLFWIFISSSSRFRGVQCGLGVKRWVATRLVSASATVLGEDSTVVRNHRLSSSSADGHRLRQGGLLRSSAPTATPSQRPSDH